MNLRETTAVLIAGALVILTLIVVSGRTSIICQYPDNPCTTKTVDGGCGPIPHIAVTLKPWQSIDDLSLDQISDYCPNPKGTGKKKAPVD